jgi:histidine phosphotransferase ChpT
VFLVIGGRIVGSISTHLAGLIGSRVCHDLISPIGAINNGLELLGLSGDPAGPEIGLIGQSVDNASARIRFFRIAFGSAGDQMVGPAEVLSIIADLYKGSRLSIDWQLQEPVQRQEVRLAFLAILCAETAMPYGGLITVSKTATDWSLRGVADRINRMPELWGFLSWNREIADLQPSQVEFALLPLIAEDLARKVTYEIDDRRLKVMF